MTTESMKARLTALISKHEQEYLDGLGTWHSDDHEPLLNREELLENYRIFTPDTAYIHERNRLIPAAVEFADNKCGVKFIGGSQAEMEAWGAKWSRTFHEQMNRRWDAKKLTEGGRRHPNDFDVWPSNEQNEAFKRGR